MRPSQYNYIKRMWTRKYCKNGCCLTEIIFIPFKLVAMLFIFVLIVVMEIIQLFIPIKKEISVSNTIIEEDVYLIAFKAISNGKPSISTIQRALKISYNQALEIANVLLEFGAIEIIDDFNLKLIMTIDEFQSKIK